MEIVNEQETHLMKADRREQSAMLLRRESPSPTRLHRSPPPRHGKATLDPSMLHL
jgi:hypothetical protein